MTVMTHWLIRINGTEGRESSGDGWLDKIDKIAELPLRDQWLNAPRWLEERTQGKRLDWGAYLYNVTPDDVRQLLHDNPPMDWAKEDWQRQLDLVDSLDPEGRYGVIWIECY